eukprot:CAMPEP_0202345898 /NCGR_PEP_ID=MMETSP1126-20121109/4929_1 /ASSEMBLY_ACC=CAM_ASM_000457 /TAXON_ID=3047 /ORGANISM="Dunaliella tertiolecta, Strain CCMP1320" /LENGTH=288 /DNA_ID=CAMNT_0048937247 /DNA_START=585 /DNA_END=1451 /DNA_ORIENTATION=+
MTVNSVLQIHVIVAAAFAMLCCVQSDVCQNQELSVDGRVLSGSPRQLAHELRHSGSPGALLRINLLPSPCSPLTNEIKLNIRARSSDVSVFYSVFLMWEFKFLTSMFPSGPLSILDLGGNSGLTSSFFSHRFPHAKIVVVEPSIKNFQVLRLNTAVSRNVFSELAAVGGDFGHASIFQRKPGFWGMSVAKSDSASMSDVPQVTVPFLLDKFGFETLDYLKVDIEGSEVDVCQRLADGDNWLHRVKCVSIELHTTDDVHSPCYTAFKSAGMSYKGYTGKFTAYHNWCMQ